MPLTPQEVASKVFGPTRMRRGYDEHEVDAFLDEVEAELTRLHAENDQLREELEKARNGGRPAETSPVLTKPSEPATPPPAAPPPAPEAQTAPVVASASTTPDDTAVEQRVARMLVLAQQTADAAVRDAELDAERVRAGAQTDAERLLADARMRTSEELGSLERNKRVLESEVEQLEAFEQQYRQRLRAYFEMQLRELEPGAGGPAAVEGRENAALGAGADDEDDHNGINMDNTDEASSGDPLTGGLSDPPGFGAVWSGDDLGQPGGDPFVRDRRDAESRAGGSPFDTRPEGY